ncbi:MAG: cyclic pyranopterin phosphate synthase MoaA [candidate division Zixibacteria bacterium RBG_16_53_22]|nr:MAG: cyclic pyranopterin phosphate synthase MoaA [candidate division Zixibacteria bacterium RBG_16_53_22]
MIRRNEGPRALIDSFGRAITYLRVSLTDKCNMKCGYCYASTARDTAITPELDNKGLLTPIRAFASLGVNKVRFTGGEPLLRRGIVELVAHTREIAGISIIGVTTNGLLAERNLARLIDAGLNRINISLDTLNRHRFKAITGVDGFDRVGAGIEAAVSSGAFSQVKVNTVVMRGINDDELRALAEWAIGRGIDIRFIEFMPTEKSGWSRERFVGEVEMRSKIGLELIPVSEEGNSRGPATTYKYKDLPGRVSFISAVSCSFCDNCNRLRLTSKGEVIGCLFQEDKMDLGQMIHKGASIGEISQRIVEAVARPGFRRQPDDVSITSYKPLMKAVGG